MLATCRLLPRAVRAAARTAAIVERRPNLASPSRAAKSVSGAQQCRFLAVNWNKISSKKEAGGGQRPPVGGVPVPPPQPPAPAQAPGTLTIMPSSDLSAVEARYRLEQILSEPYLAIQRRLEMANLLIGFEQANHYTLYNRHGQIVGYMAEESSMAKAVMRNVARTHRSFTATIFDPAGAVICKIERPFYWISSSMTVRSVGNNEAMGEVHRNWHLWRRRYELYDKGKAQFARIDAPLFSWEFTMVDDEGRVLAAVDKNFVGLGTIIQTIFTDAHTYLVHLDPGSPLYDFNARLAYETPAERKMREGTSEAPLLPAGWESHKDDVGRTYYVNRAQNVSQWDPPKGVVPVENASNALAPRALIGRRLTLEEKAVVLGCAVSIDFDFFSRHSGGGVPIPFIMPIPIPGGGSSSTAGTAGAADAAGAAGVGAGAAGSSEWGGGDDGGSFESTRSSMPEGGGAAGSSIPGGEEVWEEGKEVWKGGSENAQEAASGMWDTVKEIASAITGIDFD